MCGIICTNYAPVMVHFLFASCSVSHSTICLSVILPLFDPFSVFFSFSGLPCFTLFDNHLDYWTWPALPKTLFNTWTRSPFHLHNSCLLQFPRSCTCLTLKDSQGDSAGPPSEPELRVILLLSGKAWLWKMSTFKSSYDTFAKELRKMLDTTREAVKALFEMALIFVLAAS